MSRSKHKKSGIKICLLLITLLTSGTFAANLDGVRHRDKNTYGLTSVSMAGGLQFGIDGVGFNSTTTNNTVVFKSVNTEGFEIVGPTLSGKCFFVSFEFD